MLSFTRFRGVYKFIHFYPSRFYRRGRSKHLHKVYATRLKRVKRRNIKMKKFNYKIGCSLGL